MRNCHQTIEALSKLVGKVEVEDIHFKSISAAACTHTHQFISNNVMMHQSMREWTAHRTLVTILWSLICNAHLHFRIKHQHKTRIANRQRKIDAKICVRKWKRNFYDHLIASETRNGYLNMNKKTNGRTERKISTWAQYTMVITDLSIEHWQVGPSPGTHITVLWRHSACTFALAIITICMHWY